MKVAVLMGSEKDMPKMQSCMDVLDEFGIEHEVHVMSAHRTPERVAAFVSSARDNGFGVIVCGAGKAAHLAGAAAVALRRQEEQDGARTSAQMESQPRC